MNRMEKAKALYHEKYGKRGLDVGEARYEEGTKDKGAGAYYAHGGTKEHAKHARQAVSAMAHEAGLDRRFIKKGLRKDAEAGLIE